MLTLLFTRSNYQAGVGSSILESATIEDVWIQNSNMVQLTVYNTGTATNLGTNLDLTIAAIYVNGVPLTTTNSPSAPINFNELVGAGDHVSIDGWYWLAGGFPKWANL